MRQSRFTVWLQARPSQRELEHWELSGGLLRWFHGSEKPIRRSAVSGTEGSAGKGKMAGRKDGQTLPQGEAGQRM